jgi:hypothetical protein
MEYRSDVYVQSFDMCRAFDSVDKNLLEMSWARLHVPRELAKYIVDLDRGNSTVLRTPWAISLVKEHGHELYDALVRLQLVFERVRGTQQGGKSSPLNWVALFDMVLSGLDICSEGLIVQDDCNEMHSVGEICFVDDLLTVQRSSEALQMQADVMSAFAVVFGLKFSVQKFRAMAVRWGNKNRPLEDTIIMHKHGWRDQDVEIVKLENRGCI